MPGILNPDRPQQILHHRVGVVAVAEARPEIDLPTQRPARAVVAPKLERLPRRRVEFRRCPRDLASRMQPEEMRHMPVVHVPLHEIVGPLLQLAARTDLQREEFRTRRRELGGEFGFDAEHLRRF